MKIEEAVQYMSKLYLERVIKSFTKDYPSKKSIEEYREIINRNSELLSKEENITQRFNSFIKENRNDPYEKYLLYGFIIRSILAQPEVKSTEENVLKSVSEKEKEIISLSKTPDSFKHIDERSIEIFSLILETALEDGIISNDELVLIDRVRKKLSLSEKDQFLIQARLKYFPSKEKDEHTRPEIIKGLEDLQKIGILFYCNQYEGSEEPIFVIPDEIIPGIKETLGIELTEYKYKLLLGYFQKKHLSDVLKARNLQYSGIKEDLINRIIHSGIQPSEALNYLTTADLSDLCSEISSLKVSGTKDEKVKRLIKYHSRLVIKEFEKDDTGQKYYEYLEELSSRDIDNLLGNKIVKDHDFIDKAFEDGTKYLFKEKLNIDLIEFSGNEHADGGAVFESGESILLWDNKSRKNGTPYTFPEEHLNQFLRYIKNESKKGRRVNCFLIVTATIDNSVQKNAVLLKSKSGVDTDVAIITAENLKLVAEGWKKYSTRSSFNLNIFNTTGILDWETLRDRMNWHD